MDPVGTYHTITFNLSQWPANFNIYIYIHTKITKRNNSFGYFWGLLSGWQSRIPNSRSMSSKPARWAKSYGVGDVYLPTLILRPENFTGWNSYKSSNWKGISYSKPPCWSYILDILIFRGVRGGGRGMKSVKSIQFHISTLPEASLTNKNRPSQKEMSCSHHWFSAAMLVWGGIRKYFACIVRIVVVRSYIAWYCM